MYKKSFYAIVALSLCFFAFMTVSAIAQEAYQSPYTPGQAMDISNSDLNKAAEAYIKISEINQDFQKAVQDVESPEERQSLQVSANEKMLEAVEKTGLDAQSYNMIVQQVGANEDLRQQFTAKLRDLQ
ncbi:uncharacterized protein DUF4168 [Desulfobotulus alkaliphilus]|uniref:Uncharacterized protein DUF4168 n=1 Tax=Desulfobotulus alkaliphilus TaxID=622671 RepID=A0A562S7U1_9BACT|nr:DUF4168 domain-containing protein [Desulfobotulus alkaliphilus]TWI77505.1 uncharacterized protein DUF4168 [Desulfobotulus alkaliphilus]